MYTEVMIIPVGYAQVTHHFRWTGVSRKMAVTYGVQLTGSMFLSARAALVHDAFADTVLQQMTNEVALERTVLKAGPTTTGPAAEFVQDRFGGQDSESLPPNVAFLVKKVTDLGGRKNRGRLYLPGVPKPSSLDTGLLASGTVTNLNAQLDTFLARMETEESPLVILHNSSSDPTVVSDLELDAKVATQRRRLR